VEDIAKQLVEPWTLTRTGVSSHGAAGGPPRRLAYFFRSHVVIFFEFVYLPKAFGTFHRTMCRVQRFPLPK